MRRMVKSRSREPEDRSYMDLRARAETRGYGNGLYAWKWNTVLMLGVFTLLYCILRPFYSFGLRLPKIWFGASIACYVQVVLRWHSAVLSRKVLSVVRLGFLFRARLFLAYDGSIRRVHSS